MAQLHDRYMLMMNIVEFFEIFFVIAQLFWRYFTSLPNYFGDILRHYPTILEIFYVIAQLFSRYFTSLPNYFGDILRHCPTILEIFYVIAQLFWNVLVSATVTRMRDGNYSPTLSFVALEDGEMCCNQQRSLTPQLWLFYPALFIARV